MYCTSYNPFFHDCSQAFVLDHGKNSEYFTPNPTLLIGWKLKDAGAGLSAVGRLADRVRKCSKIGTSKVPKSRWVQPVRLKRWCAYKDSNPARRSVKSILRTFVWQFLKLPTTSNLLKIHMKAGPARQIFRNCQIRLCRSNFQNCKINYNLKGLFPGRWNISKVHILAIFEKRFLDSIKLDLFPSAHTGES